MVDANIAYNDTLVFIAILGVLVPVVLAYRANKQIEDMRRLLGRLVKRLSA